MKVLVIGKGGREHAMVYSLSLNKETEVFCAPGNGGIEKQARCFPDIKVNDFDKIYELCKKEKIDLVVPGPEEPLVSGIRDYLEERGIKVFGPDKFCAQLEGSKVFAKEVMAKIGVPTARFEIFDDPEKAKKYVERQNKPLVVKAEGLCAGKGVFVCDTRKEAFEAIQKIMEEKIFGDAGNRVVIEEKLVGEEASYIVITDGETFQALPTSKDHKRLLDGDKGPNTGGMGVFSPSPLIDKTLKEKIEKMVIEPVLKEMEKRGHPYKGFLYAGLMIVNGEPYVLEFNCRLGDPEAQVILPRIENDFLEVVLLAMEGKLNKITLKESPKKAVCVVMASQGYPGKYEKGKKITGLEEVEKMKDIIVFHAGTKKIGNEFFTDGGRVLGVVGLDEDMARAVKKTYEAVSKIHFEGAFYRKDIGKRFLQK